MEKKECAIIITATDIENITSQSLVDLRNKKITIQEAINTQRSVRDMIQLAKIQLRQNEFLNKRQEVKLLSEVSK